MIGKRLLKMLCFLPRWIEAWWLSLAVGRLEGSRLYLLKLAASLLGMLPLGNCVEVDQRQPSMVSLLQSMDVWLGAVSGDCWETPSCFLLLCGCQQRLPLQNIFPSETRP